MREPVAPDDVDLWDIHAFVDDDGHQLLERLRSIGPVVWHDRPQGEPFWAVTGHDVARSMLSDAHAFSSGRAGGGMFLRTARDLASAQLEGVAPSMIETDPPRHQPQRRVLSRHLTPRDVAKLEADVRAVAVRCIERASASGEFDFVTEVAHNIPAQVSLKLLGVPERDWEHLADLEHRALGATTVDDAHDDDGPSSSQDAMIEMGTYFFELLTDRQGRDSDGWLDVLLRTPVEGESRSVIDLVGEAVLMVNGGLDTTRAAASAGGLLPLLQHPDELEVLRREPGLLPTAVEEFVRWASPIRHVARTATRDVDVGGAAIREGDRIGIWLSACNRDAGVFRTPERYDVRRDPNPHLGFAFGEHFCLGTHLARLVLRIEFREILARWRACELAGEPIGVASNFVGGLRELPVRVVAA